MKKQIKKLMSLVLVLALAFTIVACGSTPAGPSSSDPSSPTASAPAPSATSGAYEPKVVGFAQSRMSHPYRVAAIEQFKGRVAELGLPWELVITDGDNNVAKQTSDVEDLISRGVDAIVMSPITAEPLVPAAQSVMKAGIPLVLSNRRITTDDFTVFCGSSNYDGGVYTAEDIAKKLDGKGKVAMIEGTLGSSDTTDRTAGFKDTIAKYPGLELVSVISGDYQQDKGMKAMEDILIVHPDLDAVFCHNDTMAFGAVTAAESMNSKVKIYGMDGQKQGFEYIDAGKMEGLIVYPTNSSLAVDTLVKIFDNGGKYDGSQEVFEDVILVTGDNTDEYRHLSF